MNQNIEVVEDVINSHPVEPASLITVLQDIQAELKYLPEDAIEIVAKRLGVAKSQVYSVASFYSCFSLKPLGKHKVDICVGTACHVRGAQTLVDQLSAEYNIKPGETTEDGELTVNQVHCVGACALGPVAVVDGNYHGDLNYKKLSKAVKDCCSGKSDCACDDKPKADTKENRVKQKDQKLASKKELKDLKEEILRQSPIKAPQILICAGTGCMANGSMQVYEALLEEFSKQNINMKVDMGIKKTGCHGFCEKGPLLVFHPQNLYYTRVKVEDVQEIVEKTVKENKPIERLLYKDPKTNVSIEDYNLIPFYAHQERNVLRNIGHIDPENIEDYISKGGYLSLAKISTECTGDEVITEVEKSGLRGCGGGGFSTGRKWRTCKNVPSDERFIICNGDEGDPGAFMDRSIMEGDPHSVIEGMAIGAYAIGAKQGYIYVREEYPLAVSRLEKAIAEATQYGFLGNNIFNSDFSFNIKISRGGGAFVCGESTALMQSIAGKVGEPRAKYIRSVERGLYDKPTVLNNVETFANIPLIIEKGADWFSSGGTEKSKGTKAFALVGKVKNTGLIEVPMGATLRSIIFDMCGGIIDDKPFKAVQTGGPSGGCIPENMLDLQVDFDSLTKEGSMMGSGGMIVMDESTCMVDIARYFTEFLTDESCGKCAACRLGLTELKGILEKICAGKGTPKDIPAMEKLFNVLDNASLCGLGKSAANPVRSTLVHFKHEYEAHINDKKCPAKACKALITYKIEENCTGCTVCAKSCPQNAISGERKEVHFLDESLCDRCGICYSSCKFDAISIV